jgi:hypothetical protein
MTTLAGRMAPRWSSRSQGEALALTWKEFVERPSLSGYEALKKRADENKCWPEWKKRALEHLEKLHAPETRLSSTPRDRSLVVQVFLFEEDGDAALHHAGVGGCGEGEWMQLASALEKEISASRTWHGCLRCNRATSARTASSRRCREDSRRSPRRRRRWSSFCASMGI